MDPSTKNSGNCVTPLPLRRRGCSVNPPTAATASTIANAADGRNPSDCRLTHRVLDSARTVSSASCGEASGEEVAAATSSLSGEHKEPYSGVVEGCDRVICRGYATTILRCFVAARLARIGCSGAVCSRLSGSYCGAQPAP